MIWYTAEIRGTTVQRDEGRNPLADQVLGRRVRAAGVRVNTVAPGPTATDRNLALADHIAPIIARTPSRHMGTVEGVAQAVVFLASDDATNIHGATLSVDGGLSAI